MSAAAQARRRAPSRRARGRRVRARRATRRTARAGIPYFVGGVVDEIDDARSRARPRSTAPTASTAARHEVIGDRSRGRAPSPSRDVDVGRRDRRTLRRPRDRDRSDAGPSRAARHRRPGCPRHPDISATASTCATDVDDGRATGRVVVVGAGYIGLELAEALHDRGPPGHDRRLRAATDGNPRPRHGRAGRRRDPRPRHRAASPARRSRRSKPAPTVACARSSPVTGRFACRPRGARPRRQARTSTLAARRRASSIGADAAASRPTPRMATSADDVWAAGDCVEMSPPGERPAGRDRARHARQQAGRVVGINVTGGDARFAGVVGTAVTKICAYEVGPHRAERAGSRATRASTS